MQDFIAVLDFGSQYAHLISKRIRQIGAYTRIFSPSSNENLLAKANISTGSGKIKLLCYPRFFGYVFNPLSIFYCYDDNLQLKAILYEVKNTFNEQHTYVFPAS